MIKTTYDPIMGVRYIFVNGTKIMNEQQRVTKAKAQEVFNRTRHIRAKQYNRKNSKQK